MKNDMIAHEAFVKSEIKRIGNDKIALKNLQNYHDSAIRNFQHERQIHLFITLFFAMLMLGSWIMLAYMIVISFADMVILWPMVLLVVILTILEGFYVRHYYKLENGTQNLYKLGNDIYRRLNSN